MRLKRGKELKSTWLGNLFQVFKTYTAFLGRQSYDTLKSSLNVGWYKCNLSILELNIHSLADSRPVSQSVLCLYGAAKNIWPMNERKCYYI